MQDSGTFSLKFIFLIIASLKEAGQSIYSFVCFFLIIIIWKVVTRKFLDLTKSTNAQIYYVYKPKEVIIISRDKNFLFPIF